MAGSLDVLAHAFAVVAPTFCSRHAAAAAATSAFSTCTLNNKYIVRLVPALKFSLPPTVCSFALGRHGCLSEWHAVRRRRSARASGADRNNYAPLEFMDPQTGEYQNLGTATEEEEYGVEAEDGSANDKDKELLKSFAAAIGLDDQDAVGCMFNKMRNPTSDKIVKQLEEGIGDAEDLLKDIYGGNPEFQKLYAKVDTLIEKGDVASAEEIVEGNYEALLEQLNEGIFGVEQVAMLDVLSFLYLRLENEDAAEQLVGQARELLDLIPDTEETVDNILEHVATMYLKLKKPMEALPLFIRSLSIKKASGENVPSIVRTMIGLATTYSEVGQGDRSVKLYKQILAYSEEALGSEDEDLAAPLMHLGSSLLDEGRVEEAELTIERAMKLTEKTSGGNDGRYGVATCVLAQIKGTKGEFDQALEYFRKGLQMIENSKDFSSDDSALDTVRMDMAALLTVMGREEEAQKALRKANGMDKQLYQYYSAQLVEYLEKQAELYAGAGELEKSERALRRSLQLLLAHTGPDSTQVSIVLQLLATLLHSQPDRQSEAEPLARESVRIREKKFGFDHIAVGEAYSCLASILHHQEQDAEAAELMYRVLHIQEKQIGFDNPQLEETLDVLNLLLVNLGRHEETMPLIERLEQIKKQSSSFRL